jgi:hypothetical protein
MSAGSNNLNFPNVDIFNAPDGTAESPENATGGPAIATPPSMTQNQEQAASANTASSSATSPSKEQSQEVESPSSSAESETGFEDMSNDDLFLMWGVTTNEDERDMLLQEFKRRDIEPPASSAESNQSSAESNQSSAESNQSSAESNQSSAESNQSSAESNQSSAESTTGFEDLSNNDLLLLWNDL